MSRSPKVLIQLELICITAAVMCLSGCNSSAASSGGGMQAPEVGVESVQVGPVHNWDDFNGRVSAIETVSIRPRVSGYVEQVAFKEGQEVQKGALLFVVDQRPYQAALNSAEAQLERARTAADLAKAQADRAQTLIGSNAISHEEFETRKAGLAQAIADVHGAEAALVTAKLNLSYTEVRAPVSGKASRAMLTEGNLAQADQSVLTTVVSQNPMYVYFDCDERSYARYQESAQGKGQDSAGVVQVGLASDTGYPRTGKVDFLDNRVDPDTGTIRARAVLQNTDRKLTPGMYARVKFDGSGEVKAMMVEDRVVLTDQDRKFVYVVGPENKAMRKDVVIGRMIDNGGPGHAMRIIESGLDANDKVVADGSEKIFFPGMPIKPVPVAMAADATAASGKTTK